jgi:hypothetical protein
MEKYGHKWYSKASIQYHTLTMRFQAIVLHEAPTTSHSAFQYSRSKVANGKRKLRCLNWAKPLCRCSGFGMIFSCTTRRLL